MNQQLKQAVNAFIVNEFKMEDRILDEDLDFCQDLGLDQNQLNDFLARLQEALSIIISEEKSSQIKTLADLYLALDPEGDETSL